MKAQKFPWLRLYVEIIDDDKVNLLAFEDRWHYVVLLTLKRSGVLDSDAPHRDRRIAAKMQLQVTACEEVKRRLMDVGLIDENWQPVAWDKRQCMGDVSGADRQSKYRGKKKASRDGDGNVTLRVTKSDALDTETESDTESEYSPPASGSAEGAALSRSRTRPAKRLPAKWEPSTDLLAWASTEAPLVDFRNALAIIRDHQFKTAHTDWNAVVRNWLRRDQQRIEERMPRVSPSSAQEPLFRDDDDSMDGIEL